MPISRMSRKGEQVARKSLPVKKKERKPRNSEVDFKEAKVCIADTLDRLGLGEGDDRRLNNEEYWAHNIMLALRYGNSGYDHVEDTGTNRIPLVEFQFDSPPMCKEHDV